MARLPSYWLINCVVLISMILQLVLAFGGSLRHRSSTLILQLCLWLSYISADAVAVYALGTMAHESTHSRMYGVWAPLLLLHLGGPDTITAYSTVDNELWKRHLFNMVYQVSVAVYVIYLSELETYLFGAAILILFVGGLKYGERTVSLRWASFSQIVNSLQPMYIHTSLHELLPCDYVVMGVKRWAEQEQTTKKPVTIEQVWISEGRQATDNYILCLAHALFKMNMRRYVNLYIFEADRNIENREFFINENLCHLPTSLEIFQVIEIELKFMYDALFSKSRNTAFSKWGVIMRIVNIFLLVVGGGLVYRALAKGPEKDEVDGTERNVAFVVISVALMAELLQLCRIIASDWTLVWFICMRVEHSGTKFYAIAVWLLGKLRRFRGRHYWMKSIQQYSVKDTCSDMSSVIWKVAKFLSMTDFITAWYIKSNPIEDEFKQFIFDQIKSKISLGNSRATSTQHILSYNTNVGEDLRWACSTDHEHLIIYWHIATTLCQMEFNRIRYNPPQHGLVDNDSQQGHDSASRFDQSVTDCEDHMEDDNRDDEVTEYKEHMEIEVERNVQLSRTLSNRDDEVTLSEEHMDIDNPYDEIERNVRLSMMLSNYCAYLLVSCPQFLPLNPEIARIQYVDVHSELVRYLSTNDIQSLKNLTRSTKLGDAARLARELLNKGEAERWKILSDFWAAVLINYASLNRAAVHADHLTVGGEFLTQLWALVGHMGCGDQYQ